jgi:phosphomannomutase / phosphoglucomutase
MKLIFGALAIFVTAMVLLAGSGVFWITSSTLDQTKQQSVKTLASGLAYSITSQMQLFEQTVEQIATDEDVLNAIESGDSNLAENTANKLQKVLPMALKIRLLPASVNVIDERQAPFMGYADLEMVKKTLTAKQRFIIQGEGTNRHLAITAPVKKGNQVIGVVLASLKYDFLNTLLEKAPIGDNFIEISQNSVSLGTGGKAESKANNPAQIEIANSPWQISYAAANINELGDLSIMMGIVIGLAILACVALFLGYYYITELLKKDQNTVLEAVKNLMTGKEVGAYDVKLTEMQVIISTVVQFRRILDNKNGKSEEGFEYQTQTNFDNTSLVETEEQPEVKKTGSGLFKKKN